MGVTAIGLGIATGKRAFPVHKWTLGSLFDRTFDVLQMAKSNRAAAAAAAALHSPSRGAAEPGPAKTEPQELHHDVRASRSHALVSPFT